jgi:hypothetical protein
VNVTEAALKSLRALQMRVIMFNSTTGLAKRENQSDDRGACGYMDTNKCHCMCKQNIHLYKDFYNKSLELTLDGQDTNMAMTFGTMFGLPISSWNRNYQITAPLKNIHHMTVLAYRITNTQFQYFALCRKSDHEHWLMFVYYPRFGNFINYRKDIVIHNDSKVQILRTYYKDVTWAQLFFIYKHDIQTFLQTHYTFFFSDLHEGNLINFKIHQTKNKRWYRFLSQQSPSYFNMYRRSLMDLMDGFYTLT